MFRFHHACREAGFFDMMGRHRGGRGHFAAGFFGGHGPGDAGFRTGRKLSSEDLQLLLLRLLADNPSHGYELIKLLEERSAGFYSPSPGMVYPALTYLEEIGYAAVEAEGAKKRYRITDEGRAHLDAHRELAESLLAQIERVGEKMQRVRRMFTGEEGEGAGDDTVGFGRRNAELHHAWHALRDALHGKKRSSPEEARRVAAILRRAAEEILGE